ncbi:MAG: ankyrin repeat domain-containing protein [Alphaproteobacteria bacterium]|nr:ankyrin repeat domain-containing protein [Alphaproteobacteria bacterium]
MSMSLTKAEIDELQRKYADLINYESNDPCDPIDPLTYIEPGGDHLLHIAAFRGDLRAVELLVKAGIDVNRLGDMGYTPLHYAKMKGNDDVVEFLLSHGASENIKSEFGTLP